MDWHAVTYFGITCSNSLLFVFVPMPLPYDVIDWSVICNCGISSSSASLKYAFQSLYLHSILSIICSINFHPTPLVTLIKWNIAFVTEVLEQPGSETAYITSWRYVNDVTQTSINKASYWLALTLLRLEARSRSHDISMFCIEKCKQLEMFDSCFLFKSFVKVELSYVFTINLFTRAENCTEKWIIL